MPDAAELSRRRRRGCSGRRRSAAKRKALSILAAKIGRTVYHLWRKQEPFDAKNDSWRREEGDNASGNGSTVVDVWR